MHVIENAFFAQNQILKLHRTHLKQWIITYRKVIKRTKTTNYSGTIVFAGYGEPLLDKSIYEKFLFCLVFAI